MNLDSMNKWELEHMEVADGFDASYTYEEADKILRLTIKKTGNTSLTGEQALVSIPVRVWELKNAGSKIGGSLDVLLENNKYTYQWFKSQNEYWKVAVNVRVQQGMVNGTEYFTGDDVYCDTESWAIQKFMVETQEGKDYKAAWNGGHIHSAHAIDDVDATCTKVGYTGRTFCDECNSIVEWGQTVAATGHEFELVDDVIKCHCGELFNGVWEDGKEYENGTVQGEGWKGDSFYVDGKKLTGIQKVMAPDGSGEYYYDFGDNGVCKGRAKLNGIFEEDDHYYYAQQGTKVHGWQYINDEWHYFRYGCMYAAEGLFKIGDATYEFDHTGKLLSGVWIQTEEGMRYSYGPNYYRASNKATILFVEIDGKTYGFNTKGYRCEGVVYAHVSNAPNTAYEFDENGCYVGLFSGISDGKYYEEGVLGATTGLVKVDDDYYYVKMDGSIYKGIFYVTEEKANGLMAPAAYEFGADGKMIIKNGVIDGYYYENNIVKMGAGLVKDGDDYYYIKMNGAIYTGIFYVTEEKANGLMAPAAYEFGADGKMIIKNGVIDGYYYENNTVKMGAGLVKDGDDYYYIKMNGAIYTGIFYVTEEKANGLMAPAAYEFGADGKMIIKNGVIDGYYYENNTVKKGVGLVKDGEDFYYIRMDGSLYTGTFYVTEEKANGLVAPGTYVFNQDGKMIIA